VTEILRDLEILRSLALCALGVVAVVQWRRHRGKAAGWLAVTFVDLGVISILAELLPDHTDHPPTLLAKKAVISLIALFPYFLYRFMASFREQRAWVEVTATVLTAAAALGPFLFARLPQEGDTETAAFTAYFYVLLAEWLFLTTVVARQLWRAGRHQPSVARKRMRTLSLGSIGITSALVIAGVAPSEEVTTLGVIVSLLAVMSAGLFLLGFAPPAIVRTSWRRREEAKLREAELQLMEALTPTDVAAVLLPHVASLAGGDKALLSDDSGGVIGYFGMTAGEAEELARRLAADGVGRWGRLVAVPVRSGWLAVEVNPYAPFFGREEREILETLALLAELALERADLFVRETSARRQLDQAQAVARIGSWHWNVVDDVITWSDQLYEIFGVPRESFTPSYQAYIDLVHPDDRARVEEVLQRSVEEKTSVNYEFRAIRPDGRVVVLFAHGDTTCDESGALMSMVGVTQDITERKKEEEFRERFIANAAHELRTPLTSMLGFVEILSQRRHHMSDEKIDEAFDVMARGGRRLAVLVKNLLDLSKLQLGHSDIELQSVPLKPVIDDVVEATPPPHGSTVEVNVDGGLKVVADPERLDQVVANLLTNAYRYGGKEVTIEAAADGDEVELSVADDGPGVEDELIPQLFEPFTRGRASTNVGGSGLGLAIVKMLVEACGGRIWYAGSRGAGARFCITLERAA